MKFRFLKYFLRAGLAIFAVGLAYIYGRGFDPARIYLILTEKKPTAIQAGARVKMTEKYMSYDEAWAHLQDILAGKKDANFMGSKEPINLFRLYGVNPADIPRLIAAMNDLPKTNDEQELLDALLEKLLSASAHDAEIAMSLAGQLTDPEKRAQAMAGALEMIAKTDPQQALLELNNFPPDANTQQLYQSVFLAWATANPADAAKAAFNLPPGKLRDKMLADVAYIYVQANPAAGLSWALSNDSTNSTVLGQLYELAAQRDPQMVAANLDKLTDPTARNQVIGEIAEFMAQKDPAGALGWLQQNATGDTYTQAIAGMFDSLAEPSIQKNGNETSARMTAPNLAAAVSLLPTITDPAARAAAITAMADGYGKTDTSAALTWAAALPDADASARSAALDTIVTHLSKSDPTAAVAYVQNSPDPSIYLSIAPSLAQAYSQANPQAALTWAQNLPDGVTKDQAVGNVLVTMSQADFPAAWSDAMALPAGASRENTMNTLVGVVVKKDPAQAATLLDQFSSPVSQEAAAGLVATNWAKQDPQAASQWLNTLPTGDVRDAATAQFVTASAARDPTGSLTWANTIGNNTARFNAIKTAVSSLTKSDPAAALAALQNVNITDAQRANLTRIINQNTIRQK